MAGRTLGALQATYAYPPPRGPDASWKQGKIVAERVWHKPECHSVGGPGAGGRSLSAPPPLRDGLFPVMWPQPGTSPGLPSPYHDVWSSAKLNGTEKEGKLTDSSVWTKWGTLWEDMVVNSLPLPCVSNHVRFIILIEG